MLQHPQPLLRPPEAASGALGPRELLLADVAAVSGHRGTDVLALRRGGGRDGEGIVQVVRVLVDAGRTAHSDEGAGAEVDAPFDHAGAAGDGCQSPKGSVKIGWRRRGEVLTRGWTQHTVSCH